MNLDQTIELYNFLQGETMDGFIHRALPKLSQDEAFSVIYVLQEYFDLIPDCYEQCEKCKELYDSEFEGEHFDDLGINLCDECMRLIFYYKSSAEADTQEKAVKEWYENRSSCQTVRNEK